MESRTSAKSAQLFLQGINNLLWPATCALCGETISQTDNNFCSKCWQNLLGCTGGDYCRRCGHEVSKYALVDNACPECIGKEIYFDRIARAGIYQDAIRALILGFKNGRTELFQILTRLTDAALAGSGFGDDIELLVPVPLHWRRKLMRGYNQSQIIAARLAPLPAPVSTELVRMRATKPQSSMVSASKRADNVAGAFAVRRGHNFAGRAICLLDDIKTSGATLNECARTLKQAGARKVYALVVSVAGQKT